MNLSPFCHWNYFYPFWYIVGEIENRHLSYITTCIVIQTIIIIILLQVIRYSKCHMCGVCKYIECELRCMQVWIKNSKTWPIWKFVWVTQYVCDHNSYPLCISLFDMDIAYVRSHNNTTWYIFLVKIRTMCRQSRGTVVAQNGV